jgi:Flp pilus assembly protein TadD
VLVKENPMTTYEHNLHALVKHHPELVARLQQSVDTSHITVETAHSGASRLLVTTPEGERVHIHDEKNPLASARVTAHNLSLEGSLIVLLGFGLGYLALELFKELDKEHVLLICETDIGIFQTALRLTDLEPLLLSEQVKLLVGEDIPVGPWIQAYSATYLNSKAFLIKHHTCCRVAPERYDLLAKQVVDMTQVLDINAATLFALGRLSMQNPFENMPWVLRSPGAKRLANLFAGRPGIIVAGGPSLEKNCSLLKEVKGKAVIIAADTVLPLLLPQGILPDLVVTLDPQKINDDVKFRDLAHDPNVTLVYTPQSYPETIKNYPGKKFVTAMSDPIYHRFAPFWEEKGDIAVNAQSVAHVAFNLAILLGVDPIVFIGLDLSFTQEKTHAGNLGDAPEGLPSDNKIWTTDIFGEPVQTLKLFQSFQYFFELVIQAAPSRCINATEGGVPLAGTQVMRLREVIDAYCQTEPCDIIGLIHTAASEPEKSDVPGLLDELKRVCHQIRTMAKTCRKILRNVRMLKRMENAGQTLHSRYARLSALVEKATTYMQEQKEILNLLPSHAYGLELYMSQQNIRDIDDIEDQEERFKRQLERAQVYYQGLVEVLDPFAQSAGSLIKHLETEQRLVRQRAEPRSIMSIALQYKELGHYEDAILLFEQCLQPEPTQPEAFYHLAAIYVQQGRYQDALRLLEKGRQIQPHFQGMHKLYTLCQQKMAEWKERERQACRQSTSAERKSPGELLLEAGNFYFRVQDLERAKIEYRKVLAAHPYLPEAHYHLAHAHLAEEDFTAAIAELEEVLTLAPVTRQSVFSKRP